MLRANHVKFKKKEKKSNRLTLTAQWLSVDEAPLNDGLLGSFCETKIMISVMSVSWKHICVIFFRVVSHIRCLMHLNRTLVWLLFRQVKPLQSHLSADQNYPKCIEVILVHFQVDSESDSNLNHLQKVNQTWHHLYSANERVFTRTFSALHNPLCLMYFWLLIVPK